MLRIALLAALSFCGTTLVAQSWDALSSLKSGEAIKIRETSGAEHSGAYTSFSAQAIGFSDHGREISIERPRVRLVQVRSSSRRLRRVLIAAGIGAALGLIADQTLGAYLRNETGENAGQRALMYVAPIALFGGVAGAFPAYKTVYRFR